MSATCAGCGDCCRVISVNKPPGWLASHRRSLQAQPPLDPPDSLDRDYWFIVNHWHEVTLDVARGIDQAIVEGHGDTGEYYTCDMFDGERTRCLAHAYKPGVCRDFPWYGCEPDEHNVLPFKRCSYWQDVPRVRWPADVIPLEVV